MATIKKARPTPAADGDPVQAPAEQDPKYPRKTKAQHERRVQALQEQVVRLRARLEEMQGPGVEWHYLVGSHADAPEAFEEAMRLGREWRESFRPKPNRRNSRSQNGPS